MTDILLLLPLFLVGLGAILLMLLSASKIVSPALAAILSIVLYACAFVAQIVAFPCCDATSIASVLVVTPFSAVAGVLLTACALFVSMTSHTYYAAKKAWPVEFYALIAFAVTGMLLLTLAAELLTAFIAIEIMSLAIYVLVGIEKENILATEALLKYLILGAFSGGFYVMGTAFIYGGVGSTRFADIAGYIVQHGFGGNPLLLFGLCMLLATLLFKVAAVPFHAWAIDVYDGATMPVTGFMATALKVAVFAFFANLLALHSELQAGAATLLFWIAVLTMFGGNLVAIAQVNIKRMLAASGIVHSGYVIAALVAFNSRAGGDDGVAALSSAHIVLYYLAAYSVATLGMFAVLSYLSGGRENKKSFDDFKGLAKVRPFSAAAMTIFLLSMAGIPLTSGFMGKLYIVINVLQNGYGVLAVCIVLSSVLSLWYYLRLIVAMYFQQQDADFPSEFTSSSAGLAAISAVILAAGVFLLSLLPLAV